QRHLVPSRRRHTRCYRDWSSDVCSSDLQQSNIWGKRVPVIAVRNLTKTYILGKKTRVPALRGISLEVYPGEFVAVMGPSGSGKRSEERRGGAAGAGGRALAWWWSEGEGQ